MVIYSIMILLANVHAQIGGFEPWMETKELLKEEVAVASLLSRFQTQVVVWREIERTR